MSTENTEHVSFQLPKPEFRISGPSGENFGCVHWTPTGTMTFEGDVDASARAMFEALHHRETEFQAMALVLRLIVLGVGDFNLENVLTLYSPTEKCKHFAFTGDWNQLVNVIGWDNARKALEGK